MGRPAKSIKRHPAKTTKAKATDHNQQSTIKTHWVTLCFAKTKVLNSSFKPNIGLKPN